MTLFETKHIVDIMIKRGKEASMCGYTPTDCDEPINYHGIKVEKIKDILHIINICDRLDIKVPHKFTSCGEDILIY